MFNRLGDLLADDRYKLPRQSCGVCYWGGDSPDLSGATGTVTNYFNTAAGYLAPWRKAGGTAVNQIGGLLSLPGYTALDPTKTLEGTPGYQFLQNQGAEALRRYGAGTGLLSSGAGMKGALDYGQNLALNKAWGPYMSSLQNLSGQGLGAASTSGGYAMQAGNELANISSQQAMMDAQSNNSWINDLMSGLGFAGGIAMAPFTGGTSLLGSGMGALSSLFGGGMANTSGALNSMPGLSLGQMGNAFGGSYQAFNPSSGGGWMPTGSSVPQWLADGGSTEANRPYIIGERGPELFIPRTGGYVVPNEFIRYSSFGGRG